MACTHAPAQPKSVLGVHSLCLIAALNQHPVGMLIFVLAFTKEECTLQRQSFYRTLFDLRHLSPPLQRALTDSLTCGRPDGCLLHGRGACGAMLKKCFNLLKFDNCPVGAVDCPIFWNFDEKRVFSRCSFGEAYLLYYRIFS